MEINNIFDSKVISDNWVVNVKIFCQHLQKDSRQIFENEFKVRLVQNKTVNFKFHCKKKSLGLFFSNRFVISKKYFKRAVDRNLLKRRLRCIHQDFINTYQHNLLASLNTDENLGILVFFFVQYKNQKASKKIIKLALFYNNYRALIDEFLININKIGKQLMLNKILKNFNHDSQIL